MDTLAHVIDALCETERGFHFTSKASSPVFTSHLKLRSSVRQLARRLIAMNREPGDRIVIAIPEQARFLTVFLGVIRAGLVAVPVPPPPMIGNLQDYCKHIERIRKISGATRILTSDALYQRLQPVYPAACLMRCSDLPAGHDADELPELTESSVAMIQFTSGSTASPRGIEVTHHNMISNARAIHTSLGIDPMRDRAVSWLPFHHDMGLMGFLITPLLLQASVWYLPPLEFARQPRRWLDLMSQTRATISYAPNFAYELAARAITDSDCGQWDLSAWRIAGCGGEPVLPAVLHRFAQRLRPAGFRHTAFLPSYGLAEATVAVSIGTPGRGLVTHRAVQHDDDHRQSVSSGFPVENTTIRVVCPQGKVLADGLEGEIQVRGPGVARRIRDDTGTRPLTDSHGWLSTGDRGFLLQGELHVCGRIKETILINGRNHYAQDIEECTLAIDGVQRGRVVAFGRPGAGSEQLVLIVECRSATAKTTLERTLRSTIRQRLGLGVADVVIVDHGTIGRTTSGKIRRHALKQRYLAGEFTTAPACC